MNHIIIDTETAPASKSVRGCRPDNMRAYDIAWAVVDADGNELERRHFIIAETFNDPDRMASAYYADKVPDYYQMGIRPVKLVDAWKCFTWDVETWGVSEVWAFNCDFDRKALDASISEASGGFVPEWCDGGMWRDLWEWAGTSITATRKFCKWAAETGHLTAKGNPMTGVEPLTRYLTGDTSFSERHMADSDVTDEVEIFRVCARRKQRKPTTTGRGWKASAEVMKLMRASA